MDFGPSVSHDPGVRLGGRAGHAPRTKDNQPVPVPAPHPVISREVPSADRKEFAFERGGQNDSTFASRQPCWRRAAPVRHFPKTLWPLPIASLKHRKGEVLPLHNSIMKRFVSAAVAALLFSGCAQLSTLKNVEPAAPSIGTIAAGLPTERLQRADPEVALSLYLAIAAKLRRT